MGQVSENRRASALDLVQELDHEEFLLLHDRASSLRVVVAIHDTTLGPAIGGTRMRRFASLDQAVSETLSLARITTYAVAARG